MKTIFVIGGMGAGKSSATHALASCGLPVVDLDQIGHDVLGWNDVKCELVQVFGAQVIAPEGEVDRAALSQAAFATLETTASLNAITHPAIEQALREKLAAYAADGCEAVVVELSSFDGKRPSLTALADCVVLVRAPESVRVQRAVNAGWRAEDVRARMACQLSDNDRLYFAQVVFDNDGSSEQLSDQVVSWWHSYKERGFPKLHTVYEHSGGSGKGTEASAAEPDSAAVAPEVAPAPAPSPAAAASAVTSVPASASSPAAAHATAPVPARAPITASKERDDICG